MRENGTFNLDMSSETEMSADEHGNPVHRLVEFGYGSKTMSF